ncbi:transposase [Larkinella insperata]|uniref:Transposase n=1 Tax=Larkinella insperata TaxID=332158 RepID=A0ABW3Q6S2_9BACT|nr:transposase [Larkinella insperata]
MAYWQILYQIVFGTKYRKPTTNEALYRYIWGVLENKNCRLFRINGVGDHVHILCDLHPAVALANLVKDVKAGSSIWMKQSGLFPDFEGWAVGYSAFT